MVAKQPIPPRSDERSPYGIFERTSDQGNTYRLISGVTISDPQLSTQALTFLIDGGGAVLTVGTKGSLQVPYAATITGWTLLADQSGSVVVDIWKDVYSAYPPLLNDSITASAKPTIASDTKGTSTTLTGWNTTINAGDILRFNVDSATTITRTTVVLTLQRAS